jgi:hypothetical protein
LCGNILSMLNVDFNNGLVAITSLLCTIISFMLCVRGVNFVRQCLVQIIFSIINIVHKLVYCFQRSFIFPHYFPKGIYISLYTIDRHNYNTVILKR